MITDIEMNAMETLIGQCKDDEVKKTLEIVQDMLANLDADGFNSDADEYNFVNEYSDKINRNINLLGRAKDSVVIGAQAQGLTDAIKEHYKNNNLVDAYKCWCAIYDLFEPGENTTDAERFAMFNEQQKYISQIDDKTVYAVCDYGREKAYTEMGYFSPTQTNLSEKNSLTSQITKADNIKKSFHSSKEINHNSDIEMS